MSASNKGVTDSGQNGPSGSVEDEPDAMLAFARHLGPRLIGPGGNLTPQAEIQMGLFSDEDRAKIVEEFVGSLTPSNVSPAVWMRWLNGGPGPFASGAIKKPVTVQQGMGKTVSRGPKSIGTAREKVERARAELAQAERELEYSESLNKGLLQYVVTDHLVEVLSGVFAMGPAWTVMRSLSAHLSDTQAEAETFDLIGKEKDRAVEAMRLARKAETALLMDVLDLGSGNDKFEGDVRAAVVKVCKDWDKKRDKLTADGRKRRSQDKMKSEVHPKAQNDIEHVLNGLNQQGEALVA